MSSGFLDLSGLSKWTSCFTLIFVVLIDFEFIIFSPLISWSAGLVLVPVSGFHMKRFQSWKYFYLEKKFFKKVFFSTFRGFLTWPFPHTVSIAPLLTIPLGTLGAGVRMVVATRHSRSFSIHLVMAFLCHKWIALTAVKFNMI